MQEHELLMQDALIVVASAGITNVKSYPRLGSAELSLIWPPKDNRGAARLYKDVTIVPKNDLVFLFSLYPTPLFCRSFASVIRIVCSRYC